MRLLGPRYRRALAHLRARPRTATFAAHCTGGLRTLFPRMASDAAVSYRRFAITNLAAAAVWGTGLILVGRAAGTALDQLRATVGFFGIPLVLAALALSGAYRRLGPTR